MTPAEAKEYVQSRRPGAMIVASRRGHSSVRWRYSVRTGYYPAGELLSGSHKTADAAWLKAAFNVQRRRA